MNVISLKDYAKQHNISYEAVRKQVARFKSELGIHVIQDCRQQLLDEDAVAFLDARREKNPIVIYQQDKDAKIKDLDEKNSVLLTKVAELQDKIIAMQEEKIELADKIAKVELLESSKDAAEKKVSDLELALTNSRKAVEEAEKQAVSIRKENLEIEKKLETAEKNAQENEKEAARAKEEAEKIASELADLKRERDNVVQMTTWQFSRLKKAQKAAMKKQAREEKRKGTSQPPIAKARGL